MTKALPVQGVDARGTFGANARRILKVRIAEYYAYTPVVEQEFASAQLHELRIAAKRLRYSLELFRTVFGKPGGRNIERIKAIQEELGNIHDTDVRIAMIREELITLADEQVSTTIDELLRSGEQQHRSLVTRALRPPPDDPRRGLYSLLCRQAIERHQAYVRFVEQWRQFEREGMRAELVELSREQGQS